MDADPNSFRYSHYLKPRPSLFGGARLFPATGSSRPTKRLGLIVLKQVLPPLVDDAED